MARRRKILQWILAPIVLITIALGWTYPILGFSVPIVMVMGMVGGVLNGRYVCGNLCPRGSFFDRMVAPLSPKKPLPAWIRSLWLRLALMAFLMGFMAYQISRNPSDWRHWGQVFWMMCVVTTAVGVFLGLTAHHRAWCAFCPMGTMQNLFARTIKSRLLIDPKLCRKCRLCEKVCPLSLPIVSHLESGVMSDPDCVKCSECVVACPVDALAWSTGTKTEPQSTPKKADSGKA